MVTARPGPGAALAELAGIDFHTARVILERRELDALAIVCKAADFERSLFLTFAVLVLDRDGRVVMMNPALRAMLLLGGLLVILALL